MPQNQFRAHLVSPIGRLPTSRDDESADPTSSSGRIASIENALDRARTAYRERRYRDAIDEYKRARSLAYQLLEPNHDVGAHVADDDSVLPVGREIEKALAEGGLKLAESMREEIPSPEPPISVPGAELPDADVPDVGYVEADESVEPLRTELTTGLRRLEAGATGEAISTFQSVTRRLDEPESDAERSVAAAAALDSSSALLLDGRFEAAEAAASRAETLFSAVNDDIGVAEARHNRGVALHRLGSGEAAASAFESASEHLQRSLPPIVADERAAGGDTPSEPPFSGDPEAEDSGGAAEDRSVAADDSGGAAEDRSVEGGSDTDDGPSGGDTGVLGGATIGNVSIPGSVLGGGGGGSGQPSVDAASAGTTELPTELATRSLPLISTPIEPTLDPTALQFIEDQRSQRLALRWPGDRGWAAIPTDGKRAPDWRLDVSVAGGRQSIEWTDGARPEPTSVLETVLQPRLEATSPDELAWTPANPAETAIQLSHVYSFVVPQGIGDCYRELGQYARAEQYYLQAADYSYLNTALEGTNLWTKLAEAVLEWGDEQYREGNHDVCTEVYGRLVTSDLSVPSSSSLYDREAFSEARGAAETVLQRLDEPPPDDVDPAVARPLLTVCSRWKQLNAGMGFYGDPVTPRFTFDHLQSVALEFAERASRAEQQYVDFTARAETEEATRRELRKKATMAERQRTISQERYEAATDRRAAMEDSRRHAQRRLASAQEEKTTYEETGKWNYKYDSMAAARRVDEHWTEERARELARLLDRGGFFTSDQAAIGGAYLSGKKSYEYELVRKQNDIDELEASKQAAADRAKSAAHRAEAARHRANAAYQRERLAKHSLEAFEDETFTPEVWHRLATEMRGMARVYRLWAIDVAKQMQRAFNFEHDTDYDLVQEEYPGVEEAAGLLGAEHLKRDIEAFTLREVTATETKPSRLVEVVSLANDFPFQFHQFRETGTAAFETDLYDWDRTSPGFHNGRIQAVEVEVVGLLPTSGVHGRLRAGGISRYRTAAGGQAERFHTVDTLALSEYDVREDAILFRADREEYGIFEGHGLGTTWELSLPKRSNDFDYRLIQDVRLLVYYEAKYDPDLAQMVHNRQVRPGELANAREFPIRHEFPEAWYSLLDDESATVRISEERLPRRQTAFSVADLAVAVVAADGASPAGFELSIGPPEQDAVTVTTDDSGLVTAAQSTLSAAVGSDLVGDWSVSVTATAGSDLRADDGGLDDDAIEEIALLTEYGFEWVQ